MKKINFIILILFITFFLGSCKDKDTLEWTNEECVSAFMNIKNNEMDLNNIEQLFSDLNYKKLYVIENNIIETSKVDDRELKLLFILNDLENKDNFKK